MKATVGYLLEKMRNAVDSLATGKGVLRERLYNAYLDFQGLQVFDIEDNSVQEQLDLILGKLRRVDIAGDEGTIKASLTHKLSDDECVEIVKLILDLERQLHTAMVKWDVEFDAKYGAGKEKD